jgi:hypothetical protein
LLAISSRLATRARAWLTAVCVGSQREGFTLQVSAAVLM